MKRVLNEGQFRGLIRGLVKEYVANTDGDPHKDVHADPTAVAWDAGLDEAEEDHVGDPRWDGKGDPTKREISAGLDEADGPHGPGHDDMMDFMRAYFMGNVDIDELFYRDSTSPYKAGFKLASKAGLIKLDDRRDVYVITQKGMNALEEDPGEDEDTALAIRHSVEGEFPSRSRRDEL